MTECNVYIYIYIYKSSLQPGIKPTLLFVYFESNSCGWLLIKLLLHMKKHTHNQRTGSLISLVGVFSGNRRWVIYCFLFQAKHFTTETRTTLAYKDWLQIIGCWQHVLIVLREGKREKECVAVRGDYIGDVNRQWSILGLRVTGLIRGQGPCVSASLSYS